MKRLRYIGKTLKQDVTDQKTCSKLVTKQGEGKTLKQKKKNVCFIVSLRFTLFRNELCLLVCYILFQRFSSISYSFHLLRNRNGFIKKKKMYVSSFHFVSLCFVTSIFQIVWSVTSCFRDFPLYLIRFICYETEMGL